MTSYTPSRDDLKEAYYRLQDEIQQTLGRALGYPRYVDNPKNFPGSTDEDGVCVGEHVAETIAAEAASRIAKLEAALRRIAIAPAGRCGPDLRECIEVARAALFGHQP